MKMLYCFPLLHIQTVQFQFTSSLSNAAFRLNPILNGRRRERERETAARDNEEIRLPSPSLYFSSSSPSSLSSPPRTLFLQSSKEWSVIKHSSRGHFYFYICYVRLHLHILWTFHTSTLNRTQTPTEPVLIQIYGASGGRFSSVNESTYSLSI